jgi:hypothetical protein
VEVKGGIMQRLAFYHPTEVRLWERVSGYKVEYLPVKEGDQTIIRNFGEPVGKLVLEQSGELGQLCAVTYWDSEEV